MLRAVLLFVLLIAGAFLAERLDPGLPPPPAAEIAAVRAAQWRMLLGFFLFVSACVALFFAAMFRSDSEPKTTELPAEPVGLLETVHYAKD
jgi:hypothetical protein